MARTTNWPRKAVLSVFLNPGDECTLYRFYTVDKDIRFRLDMPQVFIARLQEHGVKSLVMAERIFGCPHEEAIDYPKGEPCPLCPFWKGRDRWAALE